VVDEAERQIRLILDPPTADVGAIYPGRVVNITKFGAFVNILPGRDGLLHISKIGGGRRIDRVEDVLELGQEVEVEVEDIDPNGKISLRIAGDDSAPASGGGGGDRGERSERRGGGTALATRRSTEVDPDAVEMSFEDSFAANALADFGELGPEGAALAADDDRGGRGGDRDRGGRGGRGGGGGRGGSGGRGGGGRGRGRGRD